MNVKLLSFIGLLILGLWSTCYGQDSQNKLYGTWIFDYESSLKRMDDATRIHFEGLDDLKRERLKTAYQGRQFSFNPDNTFVQVDGSGEQFSGRWEYSEQEVIVKLIYADGMIYPLTLLQNTGSKLVLKAQDTNLGKPLFQEWYYTKN